MYRSISTGKTQTHLGPHCHTLYSSQYCRHYADTMDSMHIRIIWYLMTGVVHLTVIRLTEHWVLLSHCSNCYLLHSFTPLFAVEIERHVKGNLSVGTRWQPQTPPSPYASFLSSCFALLFLANCFSMHLLFVIACCTQGLLKPLSKFLFLL